MTCFPLTLPVSFSLPLTHTHKQMSKIRFHTHSLLHTHIHTKSSKKSPTALICSSIILFFFNYFTSKPLVCFVLSVTFVCFVFCRNENSISINYICKQTTTPSVLTIGSLPIQIPCTDYFTLPYKRKPHTHTLTHTCTLI